MMTSVEDRNVKKKLFLKQSSYSYLVFFLTKQTDENQKILFRKVEISVRFYNKWKADSKFFNCTNNTEYSCMI